jgi:magnesium transporter
MNADEIHDPRDPIWIASLKSQHPHDIAEQLRSLQIVETRQILRKLPNELAAAVIAEFSLEYQAQLFEEMHLTRISGIVGKMPAEDAADVLGEVSPERKKEIMAALPAEDAEEIAAVLKYPADSAGGIMHTEFVAIPEDLTIGEAIQHLRDSQEELDSERFFYVYVVDAPGRLTGVVRIRDLLFLRQTRRIRDIMIREVRAVSVHADQEKIANLFHDYGFVALPVVDDLGKLRGIVTSEDALDVMREEATEDMQRMVGLSGEEGLDTSWKISIRQRLPWLYINLGTAFIAGWVVSLFEATIARYAVLAIFLPIIAGQGGNAGAQTLTILVRSLALGEVRMEQKRKVLIKELLLGLLSGLAIGVVVGFISWAWKGNIILGIVTCLAMILNMLAAAVFGVVIPLGLKALKIDPALASAIMLTTVTDVFGFFSFLGLAVLGFHYFPQR